MLLINAHLPFFWEGEEVLLTTNYLWNKSLTKSFLHKTPIEMGVGIKPNLSYLHVFKDVVLTPLFIKIIDINKFTYTKLYILMIFIKIQNLSVYAKI
jgi:hypothetical protein